MVDLQVFAAPRITLKPLVPSFPCFAKICVSLMEKVHSIHLFRPFRVKFTNFIFHSKFITLQPHVDFGLRLFGADLMSIPGLYRFVQVNTSSL